MRVLGIDPGMSGAVALWDTRTQSLDVRRNFKRLSHIGTAVRDLCADGVTFAVVELVGARPGQGVTSMFTFGRSAGAAMGALDVLGVPFVEVAPAKWVGHYRKQFGLEDVDFNSPEVAGRMFPNFLNLFARKLDHGTADACLLAAYAAAIVESEGHLETSRTKDRDKIGAISVPVF